MARDMEFGKRMAQLQGEMTDSAFADLIDLSPPMVAKYAEGSLPKLDTLVKIAERCGVTLDWLATGRGPMILSDASTYAEDAYEVPRLDVEASAGGGLVVHAEDEIDRISFDVRWLRALGVTPSNARVIMARGDSMEPLIRSGDLLLVDTGVNRVSADGVYVLLVDGGLLVKQATVSVTNGIEIRSRNEAYGGPEQLSREAAESLRVAGKVVWYGRSIG